MYRLQVLNPVARLRAEGTKRGDGATISTGGQLAARPSNLDGKVIGLLADGMGRGDDTLKGVGDIFAERFKDAKINFYAGGHPTPMPVLETVAAECDVVVAGFAD